MRDVRRARAGVTLVELLLTGALTALLVSAFLEGVILCTRIARRNADLLEADGRAFDLLWRQFHCDYSDLQTTVRRTVTPIRINDTTSPYFSRTLGTPAVSRDTTRDASVTYVVPTNSGKQLTVVYTGGRIGTPAITRSLTIFRSTSSRVPE